ncbi:hypothetical protein, partial [Prevotella sp. TCVGH]|uniref:hypothetical protein n=1 Tax=Prevotella sp. TCVGH TaxID=2182433 RepID=UPI00201D3B50
VHMEKIKGFLFAVRHREILMTDLGLSITRSTSNNYEHRSKFAYLRPTLLLVIYTQVMRGAL